MNNNSNLQREVQDAIKWEPLLNPAEIGVTVKDGVVTLTGTVDSYAKKIEAEHAAKNVEGVTAVVEKIEIKFSSKFAKKDDNEIATEVVNALQWNWQIPHEDIMVKVENGWVTLEGELKWNVQKTAAKDAVKNLLGVTGVMNNITIKNDTQEEIEVEDIEKALKRSWTVDDKHIKVKAVGHKATLTGTVHSWLQKDEATRLAWNAPGIWNVDNELLVVGYN